MCLYVHTSVSLAPFSKEGELGVSCCLLCDNISYICTPSRCLRVKEERRKKKNKHWARKGDIVEKGGGCKEHRIISPVLQLGDLRFQTGGKLLLHLSLNVNIYVMRY